MTENKTPGMSEFIFAPNGEIIGRNPWFDLSDEGKWFLSKKDESIKWFARKPISQETLDLLNGKPVKIRLNVKEWKRWAFISGE